MTQPDTASDELVVGGEQVGWREVTSDADGNPRSAAIVLARLHGRCE